MSNGTTPPLQGNGMVSSALLIADRYGPTGLLVAALSLGMYTTTTWLHEESNRNSQLQIEQQEKFAVMVKEQRQHFDQKEERRETVFKDALNQITKSFNDAIERIERRRGAE